MILEKFESLFIFKSHSMSECDFSDHPVSVIFVVVFVVNFLLFQLFLLNHCTDLLQILCGYSLAGPYHWVATPIYYGIMGNSVQFFDQFLKHLR